ncbi:MAG: hypothetical protein PUG48_04940 [Clostridia bacterium]|nr:hypothetical protein [Clostridia bacterium]
MENAKTDEKNKKIFLILTVAAIVASLMVVVSFFLPYASANAEYREVLEKYSDSTTMNAKDISLLDFAKIYSSAGDELGDQYQTIGTICVVMISAFGVLALCTLIFSALRKPIAILIFNGLTFGAFSLLSWDFKDRGALPNMNYDIGAAHYIYYICAVLILLAAVGMLVLKIQQKKQLQTADVPNT